MNQIKTQPIKAYPALGERGFFIGRIHDHNIIPGTPASSRKWDLKSTPNESSILAKKQRIGNNSVQKTS
jgi:hypothetical protein